MKKKLNKIGMMLISAITFGSFLLLNVDKNNEGNLTIGLTGAYALDDGGGEYGGGEESGGESASGTKVKDILTGQKLIITKITGTAAIQAGLSVGSVLGADASVEIKGAVTAELKDSYKITCYDGGKLLCTTVDWTACASGGCPTAGTFGM